MLVNNEVLLICTCFETSTMCLLTRRYYVLVMRYGAMCLFRRYYVLVNDKVLSCAC